MAYNKNINDWKRYNFNLSSLKVNERNLLEIKFNLSDAVFLGTIHSSEDAGIVTSKYQIRLENRTIKIDAYKKCSNDSYYIIKG
jgi:hypothetical protein